VAEVKRGFRKLTVIVPVKVHDLLTKQAEDNDREPGQQAAFLLKRALIAHQAPGLVDEVDGNGEWETALDADIAANGVQLQPSEVE
jgi:ribose 1,5-bisphosphokinase PhnN